MEMDTETVFKSSFPDHKHFYKFHISIFEECDRKKTRQDYIYDASQKIDFLAFKPEKNTGICYY